MRSRSVNGWDAINQIEERISAAIKTLLQEKHLYQSVEVPYKDLLGDDSQSGGVARDQSQIAALGLRKEEWAVLDKADHSPRLSEGPPSIDFRVPDAKLYCSTCRRVEPFNSVSSQDFSQRGIWESSHKLLGKTVQTFSLSFQCQSCKGPPEVFLVRRRGMKLTLSGRAPIEHVEVPSVIPRPMHRWLSGAVVAYQSGQTLAGLFLLRTLIEQWARSVVEEEGSQRADRVLDIYVESLPEDFRARFSTLRSTYAAISEAIHSANSSTELFETSLAEIIQHFDARRLYEESEKREGT